MLKFYRQLPSLVFLLKFYNHQLIILIMPSDRFSLLCSFSDRHLGGAADSKSCTCACSPESAMRLLVARVMRGDAAPCAAVCSPDFALLRLCSPESTRGCWPSALPLRRPCASICSSTSPLFFPAASASASSCACMRTTSALLKGIE